MVVVPDKGVAPVAGDVLEVDLGKVLVHDKAVEAVDKYIDARGLGSRKPEVLVAVVPLGHDAVGR